jgi:two-component system, sensor histidine kinase
MKINALENRSTASWNTGTWMMLMLVLLAGTFISYYLRNFTDSLLLYLPTALGFVMIHWFGPRVLPLAAINGFATLILWKAPGGWDRLLLLSTREPVVVFISWFLCRHLSIFRYGLPSTRAFSQFVFFGIVVPDIVNSFYTYHYTFIGGDWEKVSLLWLSDFITVFSISVPLLYYFRPVKTTFFFKLVLREDSLRQDNDKRVWFELALLTLLFLSLGFIISFDKYWFLYGICATVVAVRHGFHHVILINALIFILNYILPLIDFGNLVHSFSGSTQLLNVHLGMSTMLLGSALIGRVISDLHESERELIRQKKQAEETNLQLSKANREMDRFVYSVSHDISAPLKSIRGLIAISRIENVSKEFPYLAQIEQSVQRLENFTEEILDHSRASRKEVVAEVVHLQTMTDEIIKHLRFMDGFWLIRFHFNLQATEIVTDPFLLKVALSNLISNAIKFQKKASHGNIWLNSFVNDHYVIEVSDDGEGIAENFQEKIFDMFFRASENSNGSGLGLFIAREAVGRLQGKITVRSKRAEGTTFTILLPVPANSKLPA